MRGLYGQSEGNERRSAVATFGDRITENDLVEGDHVAVIRRMVSERKWKDVTAFTAKLRNAGHSKDRVDSMVSRAMAGLRFS
jgi:hypothetical protein